MIQKIHDDYCDKISINSAAISVETLNYTINNLLNNKNISACDLGSGLTSYILRLFINDITSVDDNQFWLQKTLEYCNANHKLHGEFLMFEQWKILNKKYDLIIYDFSDRFTRIKEFENVLLKLKSSGLILIDDMHKQNMAQEIIKIANKNNLELISLKNETIDSFGRFSYLGKFKLNF